MTTHILLQDRTWVLCKDSNRGHSAVPVWNPTLLSVILTVACVRLPVRKRCHVEELPGLNGRHTLVGSGSPTTPM